MPADGGGGSGGGLPDGLRELLDKLRRDGGRALPAGMQLERFFEWLKAELISQGGFSDELLAKARVVLGVILRDADEKTRREVDATMERVMKGDLRLTVLAERLVAQTQDVAGRMAQTAKEINATYGIVENIQKMDRISDKMERVADRLELWANAALAHFHAASLAAVGGAAASMGVDAAVLAVRCAGAGRLPTRGEVRTGLRDAGLTAAVAAAAVLVPATRPRVAWVVLAWTVGRLAYAHLLREGDASGSAGPLPAAGGLQPAVAKGGEG